MSFSQRCKCSMPTCPQIHIAVKNFKCDLTTFKELQLYGQWTVLFNPNISCINLYLHFEPPSFYVPRIQKFIALTKI